MVLLDEMGRPFKRWQLVRPFPVKWTGPELKAAASEAAIEVLELACEGIELRDAEGEPTWPSAIPTSSAT